MDEALLVALLGGLAGAIAGFLGARHVDRAAARRVIYARYLGAAEMMAWDLNRRVEALLRHAHEEHIPAMAAASPLNEPMGELFIVASEQSLDLVQNVQASLNEMRHLASFGSLQPPAKEQWRAAVTAYGNAREKFIQRARREAAMWPLSQPFFPIPD